MSEFLTKVWNEECEKMQSFFNQMEMAKAISGPVMLYLKARAMAETMREKMDRIQAAILQENNFNYKSEKFAINTGKITDPNDTYLMSDADFDLYHTEYQKRFRAAGFDAPPDCCPALVAENLQRQAQNVLIETAEPYTKINGNDLLCKGLKTYYNYIDLLCKFHFAYERGQL